MLSAGGEGQKRSLLGGDSRVRMLEQVLRELVATELAPQHLQHLHVHNLRVDTVITVNGKKKKKKKKKHRKFET